ncbi:Transcription factor DIVARICATA [Nymphaea thermarum]|nr:Transcription factor DIVARICATA [Nymphaea thermarum]
MTTDWGGNSVAETADGSEWSREQEKAFENALATHPEDSSDRWERIASSVAGKSAVEVKRHYDVLVEDIDGIESGRVPLPSYASSSSSDAFGDASAESGGGRKNTHFGAVQSSESSLGGKTGSRADQERRKGIAWTEEEHRLFLLGLEKYGKGDWRSISRNFVISRTPTQVASHAQKYFIRLNSINKDRRRSSIHDITSVSNGDMQAAQGPITGQTNGAAVSAGKPAKAASQLPGAPGVGVYGTPIGQPIGGPLVSAVGTPVSLPSPGHMAYGVRAPVPGAMVPGAPMNLAPMAYPMPQTSAQR